jgi:hypothetical protein
MDKVPAFDAARNSGDNIPHIIALDIIAGEAGR